MINEKKCIADASSNLRFAASVAEFGLMLTRSEFKQNASFEHILKMAKGSLSTDPEGLRAEFIELVKTARRLTQESHDDVADSDE